MREGGREGGREEGRGGRRERMGREGRSSRQSQVGDEHQAQLSCGAGVRDELTLNSLREGGILEGVQAYHSPSSWLDSEVIWRGGW